MINQTDFEQYISTIYNITYSIPTAQLGLFNYYLSLYKRQLSEQGVFNMKANPNTISTKKYDIPFCNLDYISIPVWLVEQVSTLEISKVDLSTGTSRILVENRDYWLETIEMDEHEYAIGLNFKCLSCNCECEIIQVKGKFGFILTTEFMDYLYNILYSALKTGSIVASTNCKDNIETERTGNYSVKYVSKSVSTTTSSGFEKNINDIYSYPYIFNTISLYMRYFIKLY
jgi:hypothetical protein